ncbi:MAG: hypothetical protein A3D94_11875 [Alphaproteobacteria bacterium RIFCSPHIGHO2_12_FULL_66_14]|nr:MAG: hypothetical protein A3D94_11875 [Alphaproteobacteria bacterium RIFCSPHIGHO2_12_FULL_66_14]
MRTFLYRCPLTGYNVQGEHVTGGEALPTYVSQHCLACGGVHLVNPHTGKLRSEEVPAPAAKPREP